MLLEKISSCTDVPGRTYQQLMSLSRMGNRLLTYAFKMKLNADGCTNENLFTIDTIMGEAFLVLYCSQAWWRHNIYWTLKRKYVSIVFVTKAVRGLLQLLNSVRREIYDSFGRFSLASWMPKKLVIFLGWRCVLKMRNYMQTRQAIIWMRAYLVPCCWTKLCIRKVMEHYRSTLM